MKLEIENTIRDKIAKCVALKSISKVSGKSVLAHVLDTAAVCRVALTEGCYGIVLDRFCKKWGIPKEQATRYVEFLCSVHDIGKIHPDFQESILEKAENSGAYREFLASNKLLNSIAKECRHEIASERALKEYFRDAGLGEQKGRMFKPGPMEAIASRVVSMHHQGKEGTAEKEDSPVWREARVELLSLLSVVFPYPAGFSMPPHAQAPFELFCLAVLNFCDFVSSKEDSFSSNITVESEIESYLDSAIKTATAILTDGDMAWTSADKKTFREIYPSIGTPRPMQEAVSEIAKEPPSFVLIEDVCGSGKTEPAFSLAYSMCLGMHGIYAALPTHATSLAMLPRMNEFLLSVGISYKPELLTSKAIFVENKADEGQEEMEDWVRNSYYKMSYPFSVGTIDQLLRGVRKEKYGLISLFAVLSRVVILDEIHSYDSYMLSILKAFLQFCREFGTPVVMMSASLDKDTKKELVTAVSGVTYEPSDAYPLLTYGVESKIKEVPVNCWHSTIEKHYELVPIMQDTTAIAYHVFGLLEEYGGCIACMCNTVKDAREVYRHLSEMVGSETELVLFHARFYEDDKNRKAGELIRKLGRDRSARPERCVVVCTQIAEQAIDIDFDILCTQLAPIDLVIQRIGRQGRHSDKGTVRDHTHIGTQVYIYTPSDGKYGPSGKVYEPSVLWETEKLLKSGNEIRIPENIRPFVDEVYGRAFVRDKSPLAKSGNILPTEHIANDNWLFDLHVRLESYPTVTMSIMTRAQFEELSTNSFPFEACMEILKSQTVSVPAYELDGLELERGHGLLKRSSLFILKNGEDPLDFKVTVGRKVLSYEVESGFVISKEEL